MRAGRRPHRPTLLQALKRHRQRAKRTIANAFTLPHYGNEAAASREAKGDSNPWIIALTSRRSRGDTGAKSFVRFFPNRPAGRLWRAVWVALAEAQAAQGLVEQDEVDDIRAHAGDVDIEAALAIEREIHHDLMAEIRVFAAQAQRGGGKLHLGATSMDIEDTVETYRLRRALSLLGINLRGLLDAFARQVARVCRSGLHGVHAFAAGRTDDAGISLCRYAQDLARRRRAVALRFRTSYDKGHARAVGTAATYEQLAGYGGRSAEIEAHVLDRFGLARRRDQHANLSAQTRLPVVERARRRRRVAFEVCAGRSRARESRVSARWASRSAR